jgi:hypothetical protein
MGTQLTRLESKEGGGGGTKSRPNRQRGLDNKTHNPQSIVDKSCNIGK